ncbi:helix-turn-helix domain-containing protein [Adhaeretor mobilis]|uniref:HTH cro/C1-type domain-containing protein n=1 Tax=Adhaeretor mobilis TaxID=1930276 RepID=A0A517N3A3_9BACT|nr:helix-turn-helix transcriptional regulator [Adhaeretor mobilis]QDT01616.1 hypothetical protein HG15A2_49630 [Adhaeretor mobilis]
MNAFGTTLRELRIEAGLGLRTFAQLVDQRASTVSAIESGRRKPWREQKLLDRTAAVLGVTAELMVSAAGKDGAEVFPEPPKAWSLPDECDDLPDVEVSRRARLQSWILTPGASELDEVAQCELAEILEVDEALSWNSDESIAPLTDLSIEWQARHLTARLPTPVDVEAALERNGVHLEIVAGLVPRYSVQACVTCETSADDEPSVTLWADRTIADSHSMSAYRLLLAQAYAPIALQVGSVDPSNAQRFALAMLLPAGALHKAAETTYTALIDQHGWLAPVAMRQHLCNQLAEQFAAPPALVDRRLNGWPSPIAPRLELALDAHERTLPPTDWQESQETAEQLMLFE